MAASPEAAVRRDRSPCPRPGPPLAHRGAGRRPMSERTSEPEVIARPDLDAVLVDDKTKELIEEYEAEARTRTFTGWWDRVVTRLAVATTLFALYYAAAGAEIPLTSIV